LKKLKELVDEKTGLIASSERLFDQETILYNTNHLFSSSRIYGPKSDQFSSSLKEAFLQQPTFCSGSGFSYSDAELHALMESIDADSIRFFFYYNNSITKISTR